MVVRFTDGVPSIKSIPGFHGVYRIVCHALKMAYVGQAFDLAHRCLEHQVQLRDGLHQNQRLQAAYNRFGPRAFTFEVLELWPAKWSQDCLSPMEQRWMDAHPRDKLFNVRRAGSDEYLAGTNAPANAAELEQLGDGPTVIPKSSAKRGGARMKTGDDTRLGRPSNQQEADANPEQK